jgi:CheY-like chemotaxis protein
MNEVLDISGLRVLVVEDEALISMLVAEILEDLGCEIAGVAGCLDNGLEQARVSNFDLALIDLNLGGIKSIPIADVLRERNTPFIFVTGYGAAGLPDHLREAQTLTKPFTSCDLETAMRSVLSAK